MPRRDKVVVENKGKNILFSSKIMEKERKEKKKERRCKVWEEF
jgi:hypothetical protein